MKIELANKIMKAAENVGLQESECRIYNNYSGRNMYGNTTTAVVVDGEGIMQLITQDMIENEDKKSAKSMVLLRKDNLGKSLIYY